MLCYFASLFSFFGFCLFLGTLQPAYRLPHLSLFRLPLYLLPPQQRTTSFVFHALCLPFPLRVSTSSVLCLSRASLLSGNGLSSSTTHTHSDILCRAGQTSNRFCNSFH